MANADLPAIEPDGARRSRRRVRHALGTLHREAERAAHAARESKKARRLLDELTAAHATLSGGGLREGVRSVGFFFGVVAAFGLDVILLGQAAEYSARQGFPDSPELVRVAQFLLPALVLGVEMRFAQNLHDAREERADGGPAGPFFGWLVAAAVFACGIPLIVIGTQIAERVFALNAAAEAAFDWHLAGLLILAFGAHCVLLFTGRQGESAKLWLAFRARDLRLRWRLVRLERSERRAGVLGEQAYIHFASIREAHGQAFPRHPLGVSYFSEDARTLLRSRAGYEVINLKGKAPSAPIDAVPVEPESPAAALAPDPAGVAGPEPDAAIDGRVIRDADSEVKV